MVHCLLGSGGMGLVSSRQSEMVGARCKKVEGGHMSGKEKGKFSKPERWTQNIFRGRKNNKFRINAGKQSPLSNNPPKVKNASMNRY